MRKIYGTAGLGTDKIMRDMRFARQISKAINTDTQNM
jgi:hypothetical protein